MKLIKDNNVIQLRPSPEALEHRYLKHLSSAIAHYLENPNGTELVLILGSGYEKNNREALDTWVSYQRGEVLEKRLEGGNPLGYLTEKLKNLLDH